MRNLIIAPTDFSPSSLNAVNYSADMAASIHADLLIMHVIQAAQIISEAAVPASVFHTPQDDAEKNMSILRNKLLKRTRNSIPIRTQCVEGNIGFEIAQMSNHKRPFAVVMAPKGTVDLKKLIVGSHTLYAAKHLAYPLLIVPRKASFAKIRKIAYASDLLAENTAELIKILKKWIKKLEARLTVLNVMDAAVADTPKTEEYTAIQKHFSKAGVHFHFVTGSSVIAAISEFSKQKKPDILVIVNRKKRFSERLVYKTEFKKIVLHSVIPVMVIPGGIPA
jgi:nucleotide-binding universal stress UspA family protein